MKNLGITSFYFLIFYGITLIFYYILPHKFQWGVLLVASIFYYLCSGNAILNFYPVFAIAICSFGIRIMARTQEENNIYPEKEKWMQKRRKAALLFVIIANVSLLILLKYINFGINTVNGVLGLFGSWGNMISRLDWLVPLGISYYSLSLIGYVTDVYFGIANHLKTRPNWHFMVCFFLSWFRDRFCVFGKMGNNSLNPMLLIISRSPGECRECFVVFLRNWLFLRGWPL